MHGDSSDTLYIKHLNDGTQIRVEREMSPVNPRQNRDCLLTMASWQKDSLGIDPCPDDWESFLVDIYAGPFPKVAAMDEEEAEQFIRSTPYPGVLKSLHRAEGDLPTFSVGECSDPFEWSYDQIGFLCLSAQQQETERLSDEKVADHIEWELKEWGDFVNSHVYTVIFGTLQTCDLGCEHFTETEALHEVYLRAEWWKDDHIMAEVDKDYANYFGSGDYSGKWENLT